GVPLDTDLHMLPVGKAEVVRRGDDVAILALGSMVAPAVDAASVLATQHGISASVVNMRFVKPLDTELVLSMARRGFPMITVEEAALAGGMGSAVLETLADDGQQAHLCRLGLPDRFIEHGSREQLLKELGLTADGIVEQVLAFLRRIPKKTFPVSG
ncbi:MAG: 1-deoxy-D-xylulose-5-phosphate synthase, partial [Alicyclobacillus sp.]|nr:1-deoxy-D-xylulose-5-phosphate synthase [Alicyclobacillus sp.]